MSKTYKAMGLSGMAQVMEDIAIDFADELPAITVVNTSDWETPYTVIVTSK